MSNATITSDRQAILDAASRKISDVAMWEQQAKNEAAQRFSARMFSIEQDAAARRRSVVEWAEKELAKLPLAIDAPAQEPAP